MSDGLAFNSLKISMALIEWRLMWMCWVGNSVLCSLSPHEYSTRCAQLVIDRGSLIDAYVVGSLIPVHALICNKTKPGNSLSLSLSLSQLGHTAAEAAAASAATCFVLWSLTSWNKIPTKSFYKKKISTVLDSKCQPICWSVSSYNLLKCQQIRHVNLPCRHVGYLLHRTDEHRVLDFSLKPRLNPNPNPLLNQCTLRLTFV